MEPGDLISIIVGLLDAGRPFAVTTVLGAGGSTPAPAGAKAIIEADGTLRGTVGGGEAELEARRRAMEALRSGEATSFEFDLNGPGPPVSASICGGSLRVLVDPTAAQRKAEYQRAASALARREPGIWLTTLRWVPGPSATDASPADSRGRVLPTPAGGLGATGVRETGVREGRPLQTDEAAAFDLQVDARYLPETELSGHAGFPDAEVLAAALADEAPRFVRSSSEDGLAAFVEPLVPRPILLIVGGGHVGQALAAQASLVGFAIAVIDDRPEFADPRRFPAGTQTRCGAIADAVAAFPLGRDVFIAIATRGHQQDAAALRACIRREAAYIGMIGSRRKVPLLRQQFLESGWATAEEFARVYAPIGLDLQAVTVPEIAASIVAQLIAVRRAGASPRIPLA